MEILKFIIDYFFIEPVLAPWTLYQKILFTTYSIVFVLLSIELIKNKWQIRKYKKQLEAVNRVKLEDKISLNKI